MPCRAVPAGVGDSLVEFAKAKGVDMVALGSRGMGSVKRSLMSLVGLGSVSDYVLHQLHVPVLVVHAGQGAAAAAAGAPQDGQVRGGWAAGSTSGRANTSRQESTGCCLLRQSAAHMLVFCGQKAAHGCSSAGSSFMSLCCCAAAQAQGVRIYGRLCEQSARIGVVAARPAAGW
jgi:hypothetical protein